MKTAIGHSQSKMACAVLLKHWPEYSLFLSHMFEKQSLGSQKQKTQKGGSAEALPSLAAFKKEFSDQSEVFLKRCLAELSPSIQSEGTAQGSANLVTAFEEELNLCLWFWCFKGDKNQSFGSLLKQVGIVESDSVLVIHNVTQESGEPLNFYVEFHTNGLSFGVDKAMAQHAPLRALPALGQFHFHLNRIKTESPENRSFLLVRLVRMLQRQVCLVVEHWEYANAVLAVEHGQLMRMKPQLSEDQFKPKLSALFERMADLRDHEAEWCLDAFIEIRQILEDSSLLELAQNDSDFLAEKRATRSLIFGSLQKICLPSSVSRHKYCQPVFEAFHELLSLELKLEPQCASLRVIVSGFSKVLSQGIVNADLPELTKICHPNKQNDCLSFECSHVLKMLSWKLSAFDYYTLVFCYFDFVMCKMEPLVVSNYWWELLLDSLNMPNSFPQIAGNSSWYEQLSSSPSVEATNARDSVCMRLLSRLKLCDKNLSSELVLVLRALLQKTE